ncbi:MAG TPA: glycosyltransferase family 9 protein [Candidatus Sulfotelmatobacter sp.]|nr:glycosyltransferase family 9 protein [Candidatus Sulfotelmatobacter sp.]
MAQIFELPERPRIVTFVSQDTVEQGLARLPYLRALRHGFPSGQLVWLVGHGPSALRGPLAPLATGLVDRVVDTTPLEGRLSDLLVRPLAGEPVDLVIDGQQRLLVTLALKRIRSRHFLSTCADYLFSERKPTVRPARNGSDVATLLALLELATGAPARPSAPLVLTAEVRAAARALLPRGPTYVGLAPGATDLSRAWPVNEFVGIARVLAQNGTVPVFLLGPPEQHWHEPIGAAVPTAHFPMQHPSVEHLGAAPHLAIALAERLGAVLANDGALAHAAAAGGAPVVGLYGPTDPARAAPAVGRVEVLRAQDYGGDDMSLIPASAVLQAIQRMLWREDRSRAS